MKATPEEPFEIIEFLRNVASARLIRVKKSESIYLQGANSDSVYYIASGKVRLSVASRNGKEATIALLSTADFFGENCIQSEGARAESATAWNDGGILKIDKLLMVSALNSHRDLSLCFIDHLLSKNARYQDNLVDLFFNFSEKRLARVLLELSGAQEEGSAVYVIPKISHESLAEMVGTTRSRVSFFMARFRRLGIIECEGVITVKKTLLVAILQQHGAAPATPSDV
ncbi:cAMP-binding domain of CRP or a regulatory subunit of cAMP-dependent protein kinases [Granulicella rosea]|uniref:cAMP-binding domain of CRP or a regulatory subunit of cAMP-dependent protein kinases n=2 Tax=Granulicella rosea TaxID=474952 RepID=A0A239MAN0_9BACT|nr:cAMP-binding domain of CRP or a regulatory subunit of cAMP-dependent protein kinases [Granulicella rosea]